MKAKLAIFDLDGTLVDSEKLSKMAWIQAGKDFSINLNESFFYEKILGSNRKGIINQLKNSFGEDFDGDEFINYTNKTQVDILKTNKLEIKKGVLNLLNHLKDCNIPVAVATSSGRERCMHSLECVGLQDKFDFIICGDEVENSKPSPEIFLKVAAHFNVNPSDCVVFEDSKNGIIAANSAGMYAILVPDLLKPDSVMKEKSSIIIESIDDAIKIIS